MDVFIEKIVVRKKTISDYLITFGFFLGGLVILIAAFSIPAISVLAPILVIGSGYGVFYFSKSRNIEYEYAVTNGELDIDRIVAQRKRKRIFSVNVKELEIIAKVKSDKYTSEYKSIQKKIDASSSAESPGVYFIVLNYKGVRTIVYFEPDERMLDVFKMFIPRKVF